MKKEYKVLLSIFVVYCVFRSALEKLGVRITQPIVELLVIWVGYIPLLILTVKARTDKSIKMRYRLLCWFLSIAIIVGLISSIILPLIGIALF